MSYHKSYSYQTYGGSGQYQPQYANVQPTPFANDYPSPTYDHNGSHDMSQSVSRSSNSSYGSGHWASQTLTNAPYGLPSPAASPQESYFSTPDQLNAINFNVVAPVSRHKSGSTQRSSKSTTATNTNQSQPSLFPCLVSDCPFSTQRHHDLKRHMNQHSKITMFPCKYTWCRRGSGEDDRPFTRQDHLTEHMRNMHQKDIPRKGGKGGRGKAGRKDE